MPRRRITAFKINEISGVDTPAQEGATVVLMKRADGAKGRSANRQIEKGSLVSALTGETNGHQHGIEVSRHDKNVHMWVSWAKSVGSEDGHSHDLTRNEDGTYSVSTVDGHTHSIDSDAVESALAELTKAGDDPMPKTAEELQTALDEATALRKRAEAILAMTPEHRGYFDELAKSARDKFIAKSADERGEAIETAKRRADKTDPVVYTTKAGIEIKKSDGDTLLALAKADNKRAEENAQLRKDLDAANRANVDSDLRKRAEALKHIPGDVDVRVEMLKRIDSIEDESMRKRAHEALKAQDAQLAKAFDTYGVAGINRNDADSPTAKLDAMAKKHQEANSGITFEKAYAHVVATPEGKELYAKTIN